MFTEIIQSWLFRGDSRWSDKKWQDWSAGTQHSSQALLTMKSMNLCLTEQWGENHVQL